MAERATGRNAAEQGHEEHSGHGNSVAAWTGVIVIMIGALIMSVSVLVSSVAMFVVGAVVTVLGAVAAKVLSAMGYGATPTAAPERRP